MKILRVMNTVILFVILMIVSFNVLINVKRGQFEGREILEMNKSLKEDISEIRKILETKESSNAVDALEKRIKDLETDFYKIPPEP